MAGGSAGQASTLANRGGAAPARAAPAGAAGERGTDPKFLGRFHCLLFVVPRLTIGEEREEGVRLVREARSRSPCHGGSLAWAHCMRVMPALRLRFGAPTIHTHTRHASPHFFERCTNSPHRFLPTPPVIRFRRWRATPAHRGRRRRRRRGGGAPGRQRRRRRHVHAAVLHRRRAGAQDHAGTIPLFHPHARSVPPDSTHDTRHDRTFIPFVVRALLGYHSSLS
jgi:hypothetical protein